MQPKSQLPVPDQLLHVNASFDELTYCIDVRQAIERGLEDSDAERVVDVTDMRRQFGLPS